MGPRRTGGPLGRRDALDDVDREIESHVAMRAEELVRGGWEPSAARDEAERLLGERARIVAECGEVVRSHQRAVRRAEMLDSVVQDLRYAVRSLTRSPGFAVVAVLTLALGIGANSAIFSVVHGVLLAPLPYEESEELMVLLEERAQGGYMQVAYANFVDWEREAAAFSSMFAYSAGSGTVLGGEQPITARIGQVTSAFWTTLRVRPLSGRLTQPADHALGAEPVVVVAESFWRNQLAGRPLDDVALEVGGFRVRAVGVAPASFEFPDGVEIWAPLEVVSQSTSRTSHNYVVVGRLADGETPERAQEQLDALTVRLVANEVDDPDFLAVGAGVMPLRDRIVGDAREPLLLLLGATALVLLVACTNLASTLLARGTNRARELAVRASLGARQARLVGQLLVESLVLALVGAGVGVGLAGLLVRALQLLSPVSVPRLDEVSLSGDVLLYTLAVTLATVLLFGLLPALRLTRVEVGDALRAGSRGNAADGRAPVWRLLVGTEVALAVVLVVGSTLLVRSFRTLLGEEAGFDGSDVATATISLSRLEYADQHDHARWYTELLEELEGRPGVAAAGVLSALPISGFVPNGRVELDGDLDKQAVGLYVVASAGALEALDVPLLAGRHFDRTDGPDGRHVAIVSQSFAERYWPDQNPLGRLVTGGGMDDHWRSRTFAEVVGVVGDVRYEGLADEPEPTLYFPYSQRPFRIQFGANVVVEAASGDPASVAPLLRGAIQSLEPDVPIRLQTQRSVVAESLAPQRFTMLLLGGFSLTALLLAGVGIYGVVSYTVARRTREMGIRLALGAAPGKVVRLVMGGAMRMVAGGLLLGVVGALGASRLLERLLYNVSPTDPLALVAGVATLAAAGALASFLPARWGTRVDPMTTMRAE